MTPDPPTKPNIGPSSIYLESLKHPEVWTTEGMTQEQLADYINSLAGGCE